MNIRLGSAALVAIFLGQLTGTPCMAADEQTRRVAVEFSGGHETDPVDRGRPVNLVAGALGVAPEVFREAFSHVRPAPGGREPEPAQVRQNKQALMKALAPYGVTNDRLDTVSNYYRYRPQNGELWPVQPAAAVAIVENGKLVRFEVTSGGSGYSSPPRISVPGFPAATAEAKLSFDKDFQKNGAVSSIQLKTAAAK
ncbi:hypothetical protein [Planctomicrobium piriforme]|uniref:Uncharacterized protein n=1 Tax=Planctomicrobium piriforme TaxID=1576369 RepID=A0A1I3G3W4_9PLAN|nr:hypothetical protein [Planctomicrobium piriforme]SFI18173.1 hypothetical protein SAMN05421753_106169 [Planctomicrobium piriforme]